MPSFSSFNDLPLQSTTQTVLAQMEISEPTPIQAEAIPPLLAGNDLVGQSATGSGKTLAYSIPLVERLAKERVVQALVLVPTRELAVQVNTVLSRLAASRRLTTALLVGGRPYGPQTSALRYGSQIIVGTPGRVKDHLDRGTLVLSRLRICVLDEADQMLDSGFAPAIEEILTTTPENRQMALFSATMPDWVEKLQQKFLQDPVKVTITRAEGEESTIEQIAYQVPQEKKMAALCTLLSSTLGESSLVFGKTKYGVEKLGKQLTKLGFTVGTLHGNKSQRAREEVLSAFRHGQVQTLLATNVAARGLDIKGIYQVINYELPESSELFTHRIGRTGRMGQQGKAITLLVPADVPKWRRMARSLGQTVALQKLTIDESAIPSPSLSSLALESELNNEVAYDFEQDVEQTQQQPRKRFSRSSSSSSSREQEREQRQPMRDRGREQYDDRPAPGRSRKPFAHDQERGRFARSERGEGSHRAPDFKKRQQERASSSKPEMEYALEWQQAEELLMPAHSRAKDSRRTADRPSGRTPASRKGPQHQSARRTSGSTAPAARPRRAPAKRSASR